MEQSLNDQLRAMNNRLIEIEGILDTITNPNFNDWDSVEFEGVLVELKEYLRMNPDSEVVAKIKKLQTKYKEALIKFLKNLSPTLDKAKRDYEEMKKKNPDLYISFLE